MPRLAEVSRSSVRSGTISLTDPTMVVFPTPKPPAIRILTVSGAEVPWIAAPELPSAGVPLTGMSEPAKAVPHFLQQVPVRCPGDGTGRMDGDPARRQQIAEHDGDHAHRQVEMGRQLGDGDRLGAQPYDPGVLGLRPGGPGGRRVH